jgi:hypothetical protein
MVTSELPTVTLAESLLNPATTVATFVICTFAYGESFSGEYLVFAILVFLISAQVFDDVDVFRSQDGNTPTLPPSSCRKRGLM